ncbi:WbqC family protein [Vibrio vulnificus]|nr:WbqC family protein [Vibrio vulnificus]EJE8580371.1 WbqC family protein [Vibrio vulnificus]
MKCAVMQPYLFPYLGYYQLVYAVDKFVFYDDVNYIKGGFINRNNILANGTSQRFTIPVEQASSFKKISELSFSENVRKQLMSIEQAYSKAPYFKDVFPIIQKVLSSENRDVTYVCRQSIEAVFLYLGIEKSTILSSDLDYSRDQSAADKLVSIAGLLNCNEYVNSPGGKELYNKAYFKERGVDLSFIGMKLVDYPQGNDKDFLPYLSMIDVLMWNDKDSVKSFLDKYVLV